MPAQLLLQRRRPRHELETQAVVDHGESWARCHDVSLSDDVKRLVDDGFENDSLGEDRFDAFVGLLGMIGVVSNSRSEGAPTKDEAILKWEGWIFGQEKKMEPDEVHGS